MLSYPSQEELEKIKALTDKLESGVKELFASDRYKEYLCAMSRFHKYSYGNIMLILLQCPTATQVAGYGTWKKDFSRHVKRYETGIQILAPCPYTKKVTREVIDPKTQRPVLDENGQPVTQIVRQSAQYFRIARVFDVSQTEGKPLPTLGSDLSGEVEQFDVVTAALEKLSPVPVVYENFPHDAKGYFSNAEGRIVVKPGMSQRQTLKTLIHEIAHAKLHARTDALEAVPQKSRSTREVEAESVAYVVCQHFGVDTAEYTFGYLAGWSKNKELPELKSSLACIHATAVELIDGIEGRDREQVPPQQEQKPYRRHKRKAAPARGR